MRKLLAAGLIAGALMGRADAFAAAPAAVADQQAPVPLEVYARFPDLMQPRLSPGGKAVAAKVRFQGRQALAILPIGTGAKPEIVGVDGEFDKQEDRVIRTWRWADDDNLLISLESRQNFRGQWFDATRLVAYNRATRKLTPLAWQGAKFFADRILWVSREGPPTLLLERTPDNNDTEMLGLPEVVKVNVLTGDAEVVQRQNPLVRRWYADAEGVVRLGTGVDRTTGKVTALYRAEPGANLHSVYSAREDLFDAAPLPGIFLKDRGKALALSRKDNYRAVYELDLDTFQLSKKLFGVDGYDVVSMAANYDENQLAAVTTVEKRAHTYYFEPRLKAIQALLEETFGAGNVLISSFDRRREMVLARVAKPGSAGGYYLYDTRTGGVSLLGWSHAPLKDQIYNPVSTIRYRASDGKEIEAVLTLPRHRPGQRNLPLIVLPHGGPFGVRDSEEWDLWAQPLAELGYAVVQPNYRGSTGYGKEWERASAGNWGERMQDDLNDAVAYLAAQGIADPKRVCMMGWSYGGYAASRAAQRDGSKYRCAIAGAGPHDLPAMVEYDRSYLGEYGAKHALGAAGKLEQISPSLHAGDFSTPILIIHGERDQRVPVAQSRNLVRRLKAAGKVEGRDFEYVELPRETHNLLLESSRLKLLEAMKSFLDKHNPA